MLDRYYRGAFLRAVIAAACLLAAAALSLTTQAEAAVHHRFRAHRHYHVHAWPPHHPDCRDIAADKRPGVIAPVYDDPFTGSLFRPPARTSTHVAPGAVAALITARAEALDVPARLALAAARFESGLRMSMRVPRANAAQCRFCRRRRIRSGSPAIFTDRPESKRASVISSLQSQCTGKPAGAPLRAHIIAASGATPVAQLTVARSSPWRPCDDVSRRAQGLCSGGIRRFR